MGSAANACRHPIQGKPVLRFPELDSTNAKAIELALQGAEEGTVVRADKQSAGRGRRNRVWESPAGGGLWFTLILRPQRESQVVAQVTLLAAVAVVETLKQAYGIDAHIKWPNDILVSDRKICGILSEMLLNDVGVEYVVIGIGLNVNFSEADLRDDLKQTATSLCRELGHAADPDRVLTLFLEIFEKWYNRWHQEGFENIRTNWLNHNCTIGRRVLVKDDDVVIFKGIATDINDYGSIQVVGQDGAVREFEFGEISIRF